MATRSRSVARRSRSVSRKSRASSKTMRRVKKSKSKSPKRRMRSKSSKRASSKRVKKTRVARATTEYQKWIKAHKAEITAEVKRRGHTGKSFIKFYSKIAKEMAAAAGVKKQSAKRMGRKKMTSTRRKARLSGLRKMRAGPVSQSAEQTLRALFSRSPSRYSVTKSGKKVVMKRRSRKMRKLTKSGKPRASRKPTMRNMWIQTHKGQINAEVARRGMKGVKGAFMKVANEMIKASM